MPIQVLIADDRSVVRQALRMCLESDPELEIVGEARDGAEALSLARQPPSALQSAGRPRGMAPTALNVAGGEVRWGDRVKAGARH